MRYFIGIICVLAGAGFILKTEWVIQNFGGSAWAEAKFGTSGGSRLLYKSVGLILIFGGFLILTNLMNSFLLATVGWIFIRN